MKNIKSLLSGFIFGAVICGMSAYAVIKTSASNLNYSNSKNESITTVEEALNDLFDKNSYELGEIYKTNIRNTTIPSTSYDLTLSLNKGTYLCFFDLGIAYATKTSGYTKTNTEAWNTVSGCDKYEIFAHEAFSNAANTPISDGWNNMINHGYSVFKCEVDNTSTVGLNYNLSSDVYSPNISDLVCVKINKRGENNEN